MTDKDQDIAAVQKKKESSKDSILRFPNVVGIGVGRKLVKGKPTDELAIVVLVRVKDPKIKDADRIPREIDGVKTDVIEVGEVVARANTAKIRPAPGGVSIGNATTTSNWGTSGCLLRTTMENNLHILSNNHVIAIGNLANVADNILQPAPADDGSIATNIVGTLYRFPLLVNHQTVDCAIARTPSVASDALHRTAQLDGFAEANPIPGWFGSETQGGGIAVADISGNGTPDLVVFHIDHPGGDNFGFYRIGWDLDTAGKVTGGWTAHLPVPGWFGSENQGGGIAVADINNNGKPDLVVFHIDHPGGGNFGFYRIGWDLDTAGNVTNGWTEPIPIPGWFGTENQGGGVAVFDVNHSGRPDLIVFHIDHPGGGNNGFYRIGQNLNLEGKVTGGWLGPIQIPGWFGTETQGAGIAVADVNGDAQPEFVVCHVDNPGNENAMFYRVGTALGTGGVASWSIPRAVAGWIGIETQAASVALADLTGDGRPDFLAFHIDNPSGDNQGFYRVSRSMYPTNLRWAESLNGTAEAQLGERVWKSGRTTEMTNATVAAVAVSAKVNYTFANPALGTLDTHDQVMVIPDLGLPGDSGAIVVNSKGQVIGLYFAGSGSAGYFNRIQNIFEALRFGDPRLIPGWFGTETQGGGIAVADVSALGQTDLIVFHIDHPGGGNKGFYRVGFNLDGNGTIRSSGTPPTSWTPPMPVPGWFGDENQGGDITATDINGNGQPDLIVFHVDSPGGGNKGFYRIGWNVNRLGNVTGGWTAPILIPGWFGTQTHGGGIAVADIDHNSRPDLIVLHIDSPGGGNNGFFRIGRNLNVSGVITNGWTDPIPIPGWFGTLTQGAGIAAADLKQNGRTDLIVYHVDHTGGGNDAYYRVGWDVNLNGEVAGGWTDPIRIPGWFGTETQGGGIAVANLNNNKWLELVALNIDHPSGGNAGFHRVIYDIMPDGRPARWSIA